MTEDPKARTAGYLQQNKLQELMEVRQNWQQNTSVCLGQTHELIQGSNKGRS